MFRTQSLRIEFVKQSEDKAIKTSEPNVVGRFALQYAKLMAEYGVFSFQGFT